jgi:hypothetical protein
MANGSRLIVVVDFAGGPDSPEAWLKAWAEESVRIFDNSLPIEAKLTRADLESLGMEPAPAISLLPSPATAR